MLWRDVLVALSAAGIGVASALVPVLNAEAFVAASSVAGWANAYVVAGCVGAGQTVGKLLLFLAARAGRRSAFARRQRARPIAELATWRRGVRRVLDALLALVGSSRWGLPIVALAAVVGLPPLYAVSMLAGASRMRAVGFGITVLLGRVLRFTLLTLGLQHGLRLEG